MDASLCNFLSISWIYGRIQIYQITQFLSLHVRQHYIQWEKQISLGHAKKQFCLNFEAERWKIKQRKMEIASIISGFFFTPHMGWGYISTNKLKRKENLKKKNDEKERKNKNTVTMFRKETLIRKFSFSFYFNVFYFVFF